MLHLEAGNRSPRTLETYRESVEGLARFLVATGRSPDPARVSRADVQRFLAHLLETRKPATAHNRYRALRTFFKWAVAEGELSTSPVEGIAAPKVPLNPPKVMSEPDLAALLATCNGGTLEDHRDMAALRLLIDSGMRLSELAGIRLSDVEWGERYITVTGKGRRIRTCPFGVKTAIALRRYIRSRAKHKDAVRPELWLGHQGPLQPHGLRSVIYRRAGQAGLTGIHPHGFRHTFAHEWLSGGGTESDLMAIAGWQSRVMLNRYGAALATDRARAAHRRLSPGDRI